MKESIMRTIALLLLSLMTTTSCRDQPRPAAVQANAAFTPDSTRQRELASFRVGLGPVTELAQGASSLDDLAGTIVGALVARDEARLAELTLSRAEFAWLYYPTAAQARPPYDLDPATMWLTIESQGGRGLSRALERLGGRKVQYGGVTCAGVPVVEGENRIHGPCTVQITGDKDLAGEGRLFGLVIERAGRWKVLSYVNQLD
jgi:hypothetical protein